MHFNFLERREVFLALLTFQERITGHTIILMTINSSVVAYLNKRGGEESFPETSGTQDIPLVRNASLEISTRYIPGKWTIVMDQLSYLDKAITTKWSLLSWVFKEVCKTYRRPLIDIFFAPKGLSFYISPVQIPLLEKMHSSIHEHTCFPFVFHDKKTVKSSDAIRWPVSVSCSSALATQRMVSGPVVLAGAVTHPSIRPCT